MAPQGPGWLMEHPSPSPNSSSEARHYGRKLSTSLLLSKQSRQPRSWRKGKKPHLLMERLSKNVCSCLEPPMATKNAFKAEVFLEPEWCCSRHTGILNYERQVNRDGRSVKLRATSGHFQTFYKTHLMCPCSTFFISN